MTTAITVGQYPVGCAFNLAGTKAYVCNSNDGTVSIIDTATFAVLATLAVDPQPVAMLTNPVTGMIYCLGSSLDYIDPSTDMVVNAIAGFASPYTFAITPDGSTIYVVDYLQGTTVDTATATVTGTWATWTGGSPFWQDLAIDPVGGVHGYLLSNDGNVYAYDLPSATLLGVHPVGTHTSTKGMAISNDGGALWICDESDNAVTTMDTTAFTPFDFSPPGTYPAGIALDAANAYAYVADIGTNSIYTVDAITKSTVNTVTFASEPDVVVLNPAVPAVWSLSEFAQLVYVSFTGPPTELASTTAAIAIDAGVADLLTGIIAPLASTTAAIAIDAGVAELSFPSIGSREVTCFVLAGSPPAAGFGAVLTPTPPNPQPGPFGNHEYEVVICDKWGIAYGVIGNAVVTQIDYELDGIGQATIDFPIMDQKAAELLPLSDLPGVREVQVWRDQVLIWWGWPTAVTWDNVQVHLTVPGLLWPLSTRELGPPAIHLLANPQFEQGLAGWSAVDCFATASTTTKALGAQSAGLLQLASGAVDKTTDAFLRTTVVVDLTGSVTGFAFNLAAWFYIDTGYAYSGPALDNRGLFWEDDLGNYGFAQIDASGPFDTWTRIEVQPPGGSGNAAFIALPGRVTTYDIRLYCPGGVIYWDDVQLAVIENVSSPPPSPPTTAWDVTAICQALVESAQSAVWSKSDLAFAFYGAPTGVMLNRVYYIDTNQVLLDCLNEFPTIGACDFEMVWDASGHYRGFQVFGPAKGAIKWNDVIDISVNETTTAGGAVDGTQVGTTQRVLGQGSSGAANDTGYAQFASYLGGRVVTDGVTIAGFAGVSSATAAFTAADIGKNIYSLNGALPPGTYITGIFSGTAVATNNPALLTLSGQTVGVDGITVDRSSSALPDQPISTLQGTAQSLLIQQMRAQALPAPRLRADGPNGYFGRITVGDVVPVSANFGWLQVAPQLMRIAKLTLYPQTEDIAPTLMPVNALPSGS